MGLKNSSFWLGSIVLFLNAGFTGFAFAQEPGEPYPTLGINAVEVGRSAGVGIEAGLNQEGDAHSNVSLGIKYNNLFNNNNNPVMDSDSDIKLQIDFGGKRFSFFWNLLDLELNAPSHYFAADGILSAGLRTRISEALSFVASVSPGVVTPYAGQALFSDWTVTPTMFSIHTEEQINIEKKNFSMHLSIRYFSSKWQQDGAGIKDEIHIQSCKVGLCGKYKVTSNLEAVATAGWQNLDEQYVRTVVNNGSAPFDSKKTDHQDVFSGSLGVQYHFYPKKKSHSSHPLTGDKK